MRTLQYVAGAVLLALLAVIAYDLHRVADAMAPRATIDAAILEHAGLSSETREQRIERKAHELALAKTKATESGRETAAVIQRAHDIAEAQQRVGAASVTPTAH